MTDIERYADKAMFEAAPIEGKEAGVYLLWMTPDPLGAVAAACRMYEGKPTYDLGEITDEERRHYLEQIHKTHLKAPLEFVKFHFFIEHVDRAFTHQMVRQRTAVFAQESLRFAVKRNLAQEAVLPPSIIQQGENSDAFVKFQEALEKVEQTYNWLIANGIPAEDARGLLPHCVSTRLHICTDLRNLAEHAGNRLCTQAQFHWREVFLKIMGAIRGYGDDFYVDDPAESQPSPNYPWDWQFIELASSQLFRPACYQQGHCPFQASFDRGCTIRERVEKNAAVNRPSDEWHTHLMEPVDTVRGEQCVVEAIHPVEWLGDERAAWVR